jgi:hypothetical protein
MLELWDGIKMNSQAKVQFEFNLHNQTKKTINGSWKQMMEQIW